MDRELYKKYLNELREINFLLSLIETKVDTLEKSRLSIVKKGSYFFFKLKFFEFLETLRKIKLLNGLIELGLNKKIEEFWNNYYKTFKSDVFERDDGWLIIAISELLHPDGGVTPAEIERLRMQFMKESKDNRKIYALEMVQKSLISLDLEKQKVDATHCWIMGTQNFITPDIWSSALDDKKIKIYNSIISNNFSSELDDIKFVAKDVKVSIIASLYRGGRYIERFLNNMTTQLNFNQCELIIVDANSDQNESLIIEKYQKKYSNIIYKKFNYKIGIYDAWNEAIKLSKGKYLTNANMDDLRRFDSFKLQSDTLDKYEFIDVVYQDFYYTFDDRLDFDSVASLNFKSNLPPVTKNNILCFNSPHNAPMWRARLHGEIGLFDARFKSAGDWDYWIRCVEKGINFLKINDAHVVYYQNPEGISTNPNTSGIEEGKLIRQRYSKKLYSHSFLNSQKSFAIEIGFVDDFNKFNSREEICKDVLKSLRSRFLTG